MTKKTSTKKPAAIPEPDPVSTTSAPTSKKTDYGIDRNTFIYAWETSATTDEVHAKLAEASKKQNLPIMPKPIILARANEYRQSGYDLKKFKPGRKVSPKDVEDLNRWIAEIRAGSAAPPPSPTPAAAPPTIANDQVLANIRQMVDGSVPTTQPQKPVITKEALMAALVELLGKNP